MKNKILNKFYNTLEERRRVSELKGYDRFHYDNRIINYFLTELTVLEAEHDLDLEDVREEIQEMYTGYTY